MKKNVAILLALILTLSFAACAKAQSTAVSDARQPSGEQPNQDEPEIRISVKEQTVAGDAESVTLIITNTSGNDYTYGAMYTLEREQSGVWTEVTPVSDVMWIETVYTIAAGQTAESEATLNGLYGTLESGQYRIAKTFTDATGNSLTAYGTFAVK